MSKTSLPFCLFIGICLLFEFSDQDARSQETQTTNEKIFQFDYDNNTDLQIKEDSVFSKEGIKIRDISFASCNPVHGRIRAYIVMPAATGDIAGILYFHWLGETNGNRNEFLTEAIEMAKQSCMSLLIQGYFPWIEKPVSGETDRQQVIDQVIDLRRALDILMDQPGIDKDRIAFTGHDYGAMFGSVLCGIDKRFKTCILMAGMGDFSDWSLKYWKQTGSQGPEAYKKAIEPVNPSGFIGMAAPATLFFQFARNDIYISRETAMKFFNAGSETKRIKWYDVEHEMNLPEATNDRIEWLKTQLNIMVRP